jgi:hypothetical protein
MRRTPGLHGRETQLRRGWGRISIGMASCIRALVRMQNERVCRMPIMDPDVAAMCGLGACRLGADDGRFCWRGVRGRFGDGAGRRRLGEGCAVCMQQRRSRQPTPPHADEVSAHSPGCDAADPIGALAIGPC